VFFESVAGNETPERRAQIQAVLRPAPTAAALGAFSADPRFNGLTHTTCVATRLDGGHANNALPQRATALVNCRILPGHSAAEIQGELIQRVEDPKVSIRYIDGKTGETVEKAPEEKAMTPVTPRKDVMDAIRKISDSFWPGAPVVVDMATGASDSKYTAAAGIPSYGIGMIAVDEDDVRAHGKDERIRVGAFNEAVEFNYRFVKELLK